MASPKRKPKQGAGLHKFVATGGKPQDYKGMQDGGVANKKK